MVIAEKIRRLWLMDAQIAADYLRDNPADPDDEVMDWWLPHRGAGLPAGPLRLPVWGSAATVAASPMVRDWFATVNGWSSYLLGRRALSLAEMQDPAAGIAYHSPGFYADPDEGRREAIAFILHTTLPGSLEQLHEDPVYRALRNPLLVLFSLPFDLSFSGAGFLVFAEGRAEPMVSGNDFWAEDLDDLLDRMIAAKVDRAADGG